MFDPESAIVNTIHPSQQVAATSSLGPLPALNGRTVPPDVMIFDTTKPQHFPNGRELTDDIIDIIAPNDARVEKLRVDEATLCASTGNPLDCPTANDVPYSATFPYLGLPQSL
jgi:hypothetical protein